MNKISTATIKMQYYKKDGSKISALGQSKFLEYNNEIIKISTLVNITEIKDKDKMIFQQNKIARDYSC